MKSHLYIDNIKCNGCATTIKNKMEDVAGISDVTVDVDNGKVTFDCTDDNCRLEVIAVLKKWGYPLAGSGSSVDKAKSYVGCMIGKIENLKTT